MQPDDPVPYRGEDPADASALSLLRTLHLVWASLTGVAGVCGGGILVFVGVMMSRAMRSVAVTRPAPPGSTGPAPNPEALKNVGDMIGALYGGIGVIAMIAAVTMCILHLVAASRIRTRTSRTFIIVVSAFSSLSFPLGTALGVFTFLTLLRPSVIRLFERSSARS